jgi:tetratricopeptide (TPR) repeat protein
LPATPHSAGEAQKLDGLNTFLQTHPHDLQTLEARGNLYMNMGQQQLAVNDFTAAIDNNRQALKEHLGLYILRANCFEKLKQYTKAGRDVKSFLSFSPRIARWHEAYWYGVAVRIFLEAGMYQDSVTCADTYISSSQTQSTAYASRAIALAFLGKEEQATSDLADALRLKLTVKSLAKEFLCTKQVIDMCLSRFASAVRAHPGDQSSLLGQALTELLAGHSENALTGSTAVLTITPSSYEAFLVRGLSHIALMQNSEALKDINKAIQLKPSLVLPYKVLEYYYLTVSSVDDLLSDLSARERSHPDNLTILMAEGHGQKLSRNVEKEAAVYKKILKQNPKFAPALFAQGELSHALGELPVAIEYFNKALVEDPNNLNGLKGRAACFLEQADYGRALPDLNKVIKISDDPNAYLAREQCARKLR